MYKSTAKIVRIAKATRSPTENRIAFHFTFGELAKSSVLDFLVLFYQEKRTKKEKLSSNHTNNKTPVNTFLISSVV
jgi:hypothetical protein